MLPGVDGMRLAGRADRDDSNDPRYILTVRGVGYRMGPG